MCCFNSHLVAIRVRWRAASESFIAKNSLPAFQSAIYFTAEIDSVFGLHFAMTISVLGLFHRGIPRRSRQTQPWVKAGSESAPGGNCAR